MTQVKEQPAPTGTSAPAAPTSPPTQTAPPPPGAGGAHPALGAPPPRQAVAPGAIPTGVVTGPGGERAVFMSEADYFKQANSESHGLAIGVLGIGLLGSIVMGCLAAGQGQMATAAIGAIIGTAVWLTIRTTINLVAGFIVGKIFGTDFGSFGVMALRFAAVSAAALFAFQAAMLGLGPIPAMLISTPVMMILVVWLVGMDLGQAFLFTIVVTMLNWVVISFLMLSIASMIAM